MGIEYRKDDDLEFLQYCSEEDIRQLAGYLMYDIDGKKRIASEIENSKEFKLLNNRQDKWRQSWKLVAGELQHFGGDSIVNKFRRKGVLYKEILTDVCDKLKVKYNSNSTAYGVENLLIEKLTEMSWLKMTEAEKNKIIKPLNIPLGFEDSALSFIISTIREKATGSFQWSSWLAQSSSIAFGYSAATVSRVGMGAATTFVGSRGLAAIAGPLAAILVTVPMLSGTAYRVTIPSVIQIAYMRRKYEQEDRF